MHVLACLAIATAPAEAHWWQDDHWLWVNHRGPFIDKTLARQGSFAGQRILVEGRWGLNHLMDVGNAKEFVAHFAKPSHALTAVGTDDGSYWWAVKGTCSNAVPYSQDGVMSVYTFPHNPHTGTSARRTARRVAQRSTSAPVPIAVAV